MQTVLAYITNTFVVGAVCLVLGVVFSQKIKDYIAGVPAGFRTAMNTVEANAKTEVKTAIANVLAKHSPVTATVNPAPAPASPPAPAA